MSDMLLYFFFLLFFMTSCCLPYAPLFQMFLLKPSTLIVSWFPKVMIFYSLIHGLLLILHPSMKTMMKKKKISSSSSVKVESSDEVVTLLDLPDLVLESILHRLSPPQLCTTAAVCKSLTHWSTSDYFWEKHINRKWGTLIDAPAAATYHQWQQSHSPTTTTSQNQKGLFFLTTALWPRRRSKPTNTSSLVPAPDSLMAFYLSLETGKFWFPAQVYNRENGHVGFLLSCYDAQVSYDFRTDTFRARYSARGGQTIEENIEWNRLRKPAVHTDPHLLHVSDCLCDLKPNDHIEIQWRRSKEFPNGWWYGVVGHLESCHTNGDDEECDCQCYTNERLVLEFKQYAAGSQWRRVVINRKEHREVGNESDGFYGGIRKLCDGQEISMWKQLWTISAASACASDDNNNSNNNS